MARLDTQKPPSRKHVRVNYRKNVRGYDTLPAAPWGETGPTALNEAAAKNGDVFPSEPTITASDAPNAAKLTGLGYVASPQTAWTTGQKMTVGYYQFNWTGVAWAAGIHAADEPEP
jgi:hypothetical protein